jgi:peptidoglycan biosynthesis protein MviN/MurJ (putative lipid II flippase)
LKKIDKCNKRVKVLIICIVLLLLDIIINCFIRYYLHKYLSTPEKENLTLIIIIICLFGIFFISFLLCNNILFINISQFSYYIIGGIYFTIIIIEQIINTIKEPSSNWIDDYYKNKVSLKVFLICLFTIVIKFFVYKNIQNYIILIQLNEQYKKIEDKDAFFEKLEKRIEKNDNKLNKDFNSSIIKDDNNVEIYL